MVSIFFMVIWCFFKLTLFGQKYKQHPGSFKKKEKESFNRNPRVETLVYFGKTKLHELPTTGNPTFKKKFTE